MARGKVVVNMIGPGQQLFTVMFIVLINHCNMMQVAAETMTWPPVLVWKKSQKYDVWTFEVKVFNVMKTLSLKNATFIKMPANQ